MGSDESCELSELREQNRRLMDMLTQIEIEQRANKVPANFVQVSRSVMKDIRILADKNKYSLKILMLFGEKMNKQNGIVISQQALCQLLNVSRPTVHKALNLLEDERWIKTLKIGTANAYIVNEKVFWTADTQKRKYAVFSATVIVSEEEQNMSAEDWDAIEARHFPFIDTKDERPILGNDNLPPPDQQDIDLT